MLLKIEKQLFYFKLMSATLVILGIQLWLAYHFGNKTPFWDQWDTQAASLFIPWLDGTWSWSDLWAPHNEYRIAFRRVLYLFLLIFNEQQWSISLEMLVTALLYSLLAVMLIIILNNLLGSSAQNWILVSITLLWSLPLGWETILNGFQSLYVHILLFNLITLWGLLLHDNWSWQWWLGVTCVLLASLTVAASFFILLVIIVLKFYLLVVDTNNRPSHLPTLFISIGMVAVSLMLVAKVPGHATLQASNISEFLVSFGKALAWPWITYPWLSLILYLPFLALTFRILWLKRRPAKAELFVLALGGWVILLAIAMGYARGHGGVGPASRYMDILAFGIVVNLASLYLMTQPWYGLADWLKPYFNVLACFWKVVVVVGLGGLTIMWAWPAIQHKQLQNNQQLQHTRDFIHTGQLRVLQNKPRQHIPYPNPNRLASLLTNPKLRSILPHTMTVPSVLQSNLEQSTFVANGFYPTTGRYQNETVLGSYNRLGNSAIGQFESIPLQFKHSFIEIPVGGYLGEKNLKLQLVVEGQPEPIIIRPPRLAKESWVSCYVRTPQRSFKLVAIDNNPQLWFAFAMPRSLGRWSLISIWILERGWILFLLGICGLGMMFCLFDIIKRE